ncbi:Omega-hydroxypalmitate O-feruloyl transferase [Spatholobus suberectus]|nr:Omega-hydroxypalmitate O-feruloyl transferase [Spatholobus suberectus]
MTDEYARSIIDWGEVHNGFPHGDVLVSSWWILGFKEVEYLWGRPKSCCLVVYHRKGIILVFPPFGGGGDNGINIIVILPPKEMEKLESLFYMLLT